MTTSFYIPPSLISQTSVAFPDEEAHHARRVLRHQAGDVVRVVDGAGMAYLVRLVDVSSRSVTGEIVDRMPEENEPSYRLTIAAGVLKQRARYETFVEKAVELGVSEIVPLTTARTEKGGFRTDRAESIMVAAMKQSGRCRLPLIHNPASLEDFLVREDFDVRAIAHERPLQAEAALDLVRDLNGKSIAILIGPEGGFNENEVQRALGAGYAPFFFGPRRLRGETAAMFAAAFCMSTSLLNQSGNP